MLIDGTHWEVERTPEGLWIGACRQLGLNVLGDTQAELVDNAKTRLSRTTHRQDAATAPP
jgi:hypothetical protein